MKERDPLALPALPWPYDALAPAIGGKTMLLHHDRIFAGYIRQLNGLLAKNPALGRRPLRQLCAEWADLPAEQRQALRTAAGGVFNHTLYFENLAPGPASSPAAPLSGAIARAFGDLDGARRALTAAALASGGSAWVFLCADRGGALSIACTQGEDTPAPLEPLLCCDLWEHAYYPDVQERRDEYVKNWWQCVNWLRVSRAYELWISCRLPGG